MHANDITDQKKLNTQLHKAVQANNLKQIAELINKGADANAKNHDQVPLNRVQSPEAVELLIKNGANVHAISSSGTPLHRVVSRENPDLLLVQALLKHHASVNALDTNLATPLHLAVRESHVLIVEALLNPAYKSRIEQKNRQNQTPLDIACDHKNEEIIDLLLKAQGNSDSPEHVAELLVKKLLKTQTNLTSFLFSLCEVSQWLKLINDILINQLIRSREINYHLSNDSKNKLLQAVVDELISNGANKNATDPNNNSNTPLHTAIELLRKYCQDPFYVCKFIQCLLKNGPDLDLPNTSKKTPLQLAREVSEGPLTKSDIHWKELIGMKEGVVKMLETAAPDNAKLANSSNISTAYKDLMQLSIKDDKAEEATPK